LHTYYDESDGKILETDGINSVPYTVVGDGIGGAEVLGSMSHINPVNAELNRVCHLLALIGTHHILHVIRIRLKNYVIGFSLCIHFQCPYYLY